MFSAFYNALYFATNNSILSVKFCLFLHIPKRQTTKTTVQCLGKYSNIRIKSVSRINILDTSIKTFVVSRLYIKKENYGSKQKSCVSSFNSEEYCFFFFITYLFLKMKWQHLVLFIAKAIPVEGHYRNYSPIAWRTSGFMPFSRIFLRK